MVIDAIMQLTHDIGGVTERSRQWMASILCGAVNIEQSLELDFDSLSVILGQKIYSDEVQRQHLHQYARTDALKDLRKMNVQFIGADIQDTFLYDPHGIEYTGAAKLLKAWIGSKHKIAKATFQDFIHTLGGQCAVAFLDDNCDDLLRRFPRNIRLFRELLSGDQTRYLTFVVDRAIYSLEDLQQYRKDNVHVITWEKGCHNPGWDPPNGTIETFSFVLYGNNCYDSITYRVEYYSELWQKDLSFRRHLARLYKGDDCCGDVLPVICSNPDRPGQNVLEPILRRWVQENDILYLINTVGINEITSYLKFHYADIADQIEDRQVTNPKLRKICAEKIQLRQMLGVQLVKYSDRKRQFELEKEQLKHLEHKLNTLPSANKDLKKEYKRLKASLSQKEKRLQETEEDLERQKQHYQERIACLDAQHKQAAPTISRLEKLIEENYQKLNLGPKAIMDAIKIAARNAFGKCHEQFRPIYNNYRNDHKILRELIRAPALISRNNDQFNVALIPTRRYEKKQKKRIESFLKKLSHQIQNNPIIPSLKFTLYRKTSRS